MQKMIQFYESEHLSQFFEVHLGCCHIINPFIVRGNLILIEFFVFRCFFADLIWTHAYGSTCTPAIRISVSRIRRVDIVMRWRATMITYTYLVAVHRIHHSIWMWYRRIVLAKINSHLSKRNRTRWWRLTVAIRRRDDFIHAFNSKPIMASKW